MGIKTIDTPSYLEFFSSSDNRLLLQVRETESASEAESGDECDLMEERSNGVVNQEEEDNLVIDPESHNDIEDHDNRQGHQRLMEVS